VFGKCSAVFSWIGKTVYLQYVIVRQKSSSIATASSEPGSFSGKAGAITWRDRGA
jgi:hypothetical protein